MKSEINEIIDIIKNFRNQRDWEQFHDVKNLAICLSLESSELLENFLWKNAEDANVEDIKSELADVFYAAFLIADSYSFNVESTPKSQNSLIFNVSPLTPEGELVENQRILQSPLQLMSFDNAIG